MHGVGSLVVAFREDELGNAGVVADDVVTLRKISRAPIVSCVIVDLVVHTGPTFSVVRSFGPAVIDPGLLPIWLCNFLQHP